MRTVLDRLGFRPGMTAQAWRVPEALGEVLAPLAEAGDGEVGFRIAFVRDRAELAVAAAEVAAAYRAGGHLWLCYPKKSGRLRTDLTRDVGWEPIHALGLLGVAQVALDEDWSALRFRLRGEIARVTRRTPTGGAARAP